MKKLIVGNQYTIDNTEMYLECAGDDCEGYTCCMCGKELKKCRRCLYDGRACSYMSLSKRNIYKLSSCKRIRVELR